MARSKQRRDPPDMRSQAHDGSHHAPGAPSERDWEEPAPHMNNIMAQCIAIGDHLVAAAKRTERALRAIGAAISAGEHQFDGPGPDQQADKAEYQRIAEAMFNNLTSDLFPISAKTANWHPDDISEQMELNTEIDTDEDPSYLSDDGQRSDVALASEMPLPDDMDEIIEPASDMDEVIEPASAPPSRPDTQQATFAAEPEPEPEHAPPSVQQPTEPGEETLVAPSVPAKKRSKKKKKKAAKAKGAEANQAEAVQAVSDEVPPQDDCELCIQADDRLVYDNDEQEVEYFDENGITYSVERDSATYNLKLRELYHDLFRDVTMSKEQRTALETLAKIFFKPFSKAEAGAADGATTKLLAEMTEVALRGWADAIRSGRYD